MHYISSVPATSVAVLAEATRSHWHTENKQHWALDVLFREDESRIRDRNAAKNFALMRRVGLNLVRANASHEKRIRQRLLRAAWDLGYLENLLTKLFT